MNKPAATPSKPHAPAKSKAARERLAKALKANLARRKAGHTAKK